MDDVRVVLVDDHWVVLEGLNRVLAATPDLTVVGQASTATDALEMILRLAPDVAVIDLRLPDGRGVDLARQVRSERPNVRCLMFTAYSGTDAFLASVIAGAVGYLAKDASSDEVVDAVRRAARGASLFDQAVLDELQRQDQAAVGVDRMLRELTPHEQRILQLVAKGDTNREIADRLQLAEKTVRNYVSGILGKVGLRNRTQLAVYVTQLMADRPN